MDGEPEVRRELQPPPGADREACGVVCQLTEDRPADGFPQRVLRSSQTAGTKTKQQIFNISLCFFEKSRFSAFFHQHMNGYVISRMTITAELRFNIHIVSQNDHL